MPDDWPIFRLLTLMVEAVHVQLLAVSKAPANQPAAARARGQLQKLLGSAASVIRHYWSGRNWTPDNRTEAITLVEQVGTALTTVRQAHGIGA